MVGSCTTEIGRVEMWRGGLRFCLSVSAPFVWRCLNSLTITPFPHPAHQTGHADFPHPAFGQDTYLRTRKVLRSTPDPHTGPCYPDAHQPSALHITANATSLGGHSLPGSQSGFFLRFSMWCLPQRLHTFQEFPRVAPISCALPLSAPVLN